MSAANRPANEPALGVWRLRWRRFRRHRPGMTALAVEALRRWDLTGLLIVHRTGEMLPGEPIVLVCAAARHRRDAFAAADYAMDHLKSESWFWKREKVAGVWRWIEPRPQDHADLSRWS